LLGQGPLGQERIHRCDRSRPGSTLQEGWGGRDFVALLLNRDLSERHRAGMLHQRDQMGWLTVRISTTHGFAIKRLALQDFALRADDRSMSFCHDYD
jgi:hypothetical protein